MSLDDWRQVIDTNLSGVFYCTPRRDSRNEAPRRRLDHQHQQPGREERVRRRARAYCASKAGLNAFSEALMQEVRHDNIRVSYVMPGSVSTGFGDRGASAVRPTGSWRPRTSRGCVIDLIAHDARSLPSRVELRPSRPQKA